MACVLTLILFFKVFYYFLVVFCFLFFLRGQAQGTYNDFLNVFLTFIYNLLQSGNKAIFLY